MSTSTKMAENLYCDGTNRNAARTPPPTPWSAIAMTMSEKTLICRRPLPVNNGVDGPNSLAMLEMGLSSATPASGQRLDPAPNAVAGTCSRDPVAGECSDAAPLRTQLHSNARHVHSETQCAHPFPTAHASTHISASTTCTSAPGTVESEPSLNDATLPHTHKSLSSGRLNHNSRHCRATDLRETHLMAAGPFGRDHGRWIRPRSARHASGRRGGTKSC